MKVGVAIFSHTNKHNYCIQMYANVDNDMQPTSALLTEQPGPKVPPSCEIPEDCFSLFDDNLLQYIVDQTNAYAQKKLAAMQVEIIHNTLCT